MSLIKRNILFVSVILFGLVLSLTLVDSLSTSIVPSTGHCFTPLTAGVYSGNYICTNNITSFDGIEARIKVDSASGYGWVNSTWSTSISNYSIINSAVLNTSVQVTAMAGVILQTQIFNISSESWINATNCNYTFTSSNNIENKLCNISSYVSRGRDINSLIVRSLAYRLSGGGAEEQIDHQVLSILYSPESPPSVSLNNPLNDSIYSNRTITFNATFTDDNLLSNSTLYVWNSTNYLINNTTRTIRGAQNQTSVSVLLPYDGTFYWNYLSKDEGNNGAFAESNFTFVVDSIAPNIYFVSPSSRNYSSNNILINLSVSGAQNVWFFNGTANLTYTSALSYEFSDGIHTLIAYANDSAGNLNSTSITFSVDTIPPSVNIIEPINESIFGSTLNIRLTYAIEEVNIDSCWYSVDQVSNITLPGCTNTTFNSTGGSHTLFIYANDSAGNMGFSSTLFSVQAGSPGISLVSPINSYLNYGESISFIYIPSGSNLATCSLWGNFNGTFLVNQTQTNPVASIQNSFSVDLNDGEYLWAVSCNNTFGNSSMAINKTFFVDTIIPNISLSKPSGTYTSLSNIPINIDINDASPVKCYYNVTFAATGNVVIGNSELVDCEDTTFTLDTQSSYYFNLLVNDSAGNSNFSRNLFSVSISQGGSSSGGSGGGGGGSSESASSINGRNIANLKLEALDKLRIARGKSESIELAVTNDGNKFLNNCRFNSKGGISEWISGEEVYSLSPGQSTNYIFNVNVPIDVEKGEYFATIEISCNEINSSTTLTVEVVGGDFELNILNSERIGTKLRFTYNINNFANEEKIIALSYKLIDKKGSVIAQGVINSTTIPSEQLFEGSYEFELPKNSIGDYTLLIEASDGRYNSQKQQLVRLSRNGISGFAISEANYKTISWFTIVIILSFGIFVVVKSIKKQIAIRRAIENMNREFIRLDFN